MCRRIRNTYKWAYSNTVLKRKTKSKVSYKYLTKGYQQSETKKSVAYMRVSSALFRMANTFTTSQLKMKLTTFLLSIDSIF